MKVWSDSETRLPTSRMYVGIPIAQSSKEILGLNQHSRRAYCAPGSTKVLTFYLDISIGGVLTSYAWMRSLLDMIPKVYRSQPQWRLHRKSSHYKATLLRMK